MKPLILRPRSIINALAVLLICMIAACNKPKEDTVPLNATNFKALVVGEQIKLSWDAPAAQDFKEYSLSYLPDGVPRNVSKDSVSYWVTNLIKGEHYAFSLKTRDAEGHLSSGVSVVLPFTDTSVIDTPASENATYTGDITFTSQDDVDRFNRSYTHIDGKVTISGATIRSLAPLSSIDSVKGLEIYFNDTLFSLKGLDNIQFIGGTLYLRGNKNLSHINELSRLAVIEKDLVILDNKNLDNVDGLSGLRTLSGSVYIGVEAWNTPPKARGNQSMSNYCGLKPLLIANGLKGDFFIQNNLTNPDKATIISVCK